MPRFPRNYLNTCFFHAMTQGINKMYIFNESEDIKKYIKIMYELTEEEKIKIIAYCIMNNHAHILIETNNIEELSNYMLRLNCKYARYYNKKYNRVGYVFRNRYKSEAIYNEQHLCNCINYIYNNPVKAGMCNKPEEYKYSNYRPIENNINESDIFIDTEEDKERNCEEIIEKILNENIKLEELNKDNQCLKKLVRILNKERKMSFRKIAEKLNISREKLRKISKE